MLGASITVPTVLEEDQKVEIRAGAQPGDVIRVKGAGMPRVDSGRRGDLFVHLRVVVPDRLTAEQRKLVAEAAGHGDGLDRDEETGFFDRLKRAFGGDE